MLMRISGAWTLQKMALEMVFEEFDSKVMVVRKKMHSIKKTALLISALQAWPSFS